MNSSSVFSESESFSPVRLTLCSSFQSARLPNRSWSLRERKCLRCRQGAVSANVSMLKHVTTLALHLMKEQITSEVRKRDAPSLPTLAHPAARRGSARFARGPSGHRTGATVCPSTRRGVPMDSGTCAIPTGPYVTTEREVGSCSRTSAASSGVAPEDEEGKEEHARLPNTKSVIERGRARGCISTSRVVD